VISALSRVFWILLVCGTLGSCLVLWATERLYLFVEGISYEEVLSVGLFGALALTCIWVLPAQLFVTIVAALFYSFFRRLPFWFVIAFVIPICGLIVACWDISDKSDTIQKNDYRKLLYWMFVVAPGELVGATLVSRETGRLPNHTDARVGE
jgi:chromate transport protein ChrA